MIHYPDIRMSQSWVAALLMVGLVYFYWPAFGWLVREWLGPGPSGGAARDWSHGTLVVLFIGFLLWRRRNELFAPGPLSRWPVVPLILLATGLAVAGRLLEAPYLLAYSLIPAASGLAGSLCGARAGYRLLAPLMLFVLAVPFPAIDWGVTGALQNLVATGSVLLAGLSGVEITRSGLNISVGTVDYLVAPLCSGFNLIMALLALALPVLYLRRSSVRTIAGAFLWVPALGLAAKILLITLILVLTPYLGAEQALSLYHGWLGVPFFLGSLAMAMAVIISFPKRLERRRLVGGPPDLW